MNVETFFGAEGANPRFSYSDINLDNLKLAVESLNRLPSDILFNLASWTAEAKHDLIEGECGAEIKASNPDKDIHSCGTVCCAFGWIALDPLVEQVTMTNSIPKCGGNYGWHAATNFVGDYRTHNGRLSHFLFDVGWYTNGYRVTLDEVKNKIIDVINWVESHE